MKRFMKTSAITALLILSVCQTVYADAWKQDGNGWWFQEGTDHSAYPTSTWKWIDGNHDGLAECYYFDENGYLVTGGSTPDGYTVNSEGAWVDHGIIRQKAGSPSKVIELYEEGLRIYGEADRKSSELTGLDVNASIVVTMNYDGFDLPIEMDLKLQYNNLYSHDMEYLTELATHMLGSQSETTAFYKDGVYYINDDDSKYKMKINPEKMTAELASMGSSSQYAALIGSVQSGTDRDGNTVLLYSSSAEQLNSVLGPYYEQMENSIFEYGMAFSGLSGSAVISPDGYFLSEDIRLSMSSNYDETIGISTNIKIQYVNPGQPVIIAFPSTEGFEELVY